ncbi:type VII secretion protein EccCa [Georgenia sp. MJ170]|uniref:type VII secretion protein EccCa n=1 Tax=Georgenia sunbinii TaxID=3117728 RepID=UPI002F26D256
MTVERVHRPARVVTPVQPATAVDVAAPPQLGEAAGGLPLQSLLPVAGAMASMTMMMLLRNNPLFVLLGIVILVVAIVGGVGMALTQRGQAARNRRTQRERYLDYLEKLRSELRGGEDEARERARSVHPDPAALPDVIRNPARRWERRRGDSDFLELRIGTGDRPWFPIQVPVDPNPTQPFDPTMQAEAEAVVRRYATVRQMPVTVPLDLAGEVAVIGPRDQTLAVARALIAQAVALHAPDDLMLALTFEPERAPDWAAVGAVPHLVDEELFDGPLPVRRVARDLPSLVRVVGPHLTERAMATASAQRSAGGAIARFGPRLLVIADEHGEVASTLPHVDESLTPEALGVTVVHLLADRLHEPSDVKIRLTVDDDGHIGVEDLRTPDLDAGHPPAEPVRATVDAVTPALLTGLCRALMPLRLSLTDSADATSQAAIGVGELLGIDDPTTLDAATHWRPRSSRDFLRVPLGLDDSGRPVLLDLKESAQLGMGPHGLCVGATGSGKSEMLRTLVAALAISHPPEDLSMILVDYKGGAAFAPFASLPHVAGIIDNLADDAGLTERARSSIAGEVVRRQQVLRDAGSSPSITHYRELRQTRPDLPPLPHLFVVIDEFGELLTADPDFVDLLLTIGRIGRSIGIHLLLSSQRIEAGKLRGLETYLSYRLGLRTFSEGESQVVLDTPDAFHLPAVPGFGYLKVDTTVYQRFRAAYVSGPVHVAAEPTTDITPRPLRLPIYQGVAQVNAIDDGSPSGEPELVRPTTGLTLVDIIVDRLAGAADLTRPVWLPPLPTSLALGDVLGPVSRRSERGLQARSARGGLRAVLGTLDDPGRQRQQPWVLDLTRAGGHVAITGAPQSGRTTLLWTLAASLSLTHTPREVAIYGMDLSGGGLGRIQSFPHVGGVATRASRDRLRRLLEELHGMLAQRERVFAAHNIDSLAMLRTEHAAGRIPELAAADVVLLVDGLGATRTEFEELDESFTDLLQRGGSYGIHVVATMTRFNELRMASQSLVGTRVELRLNDPAESTIGRKLAATLRSDQPGRVLTEEHRFAQVALPVLATAASEGDAQPVGAAVEELARSAAEAWGGPAAPPIRLLPLELSPDELPDPLDEPDAVPLGLRQDTMGIELLDLGNRDQHLIVFGDTASGKTSLLRGVISGLVDRSTPDELVLAICDVRGGLADSCPEEYLGGLANSAQLAGSLATSIATELESRTGAARGSGPRIVVVVDDYDILASGGTDPLAPLRPFLPAARDLRLHVLLTRPVAGASRALYDPILQTLRDTGGTGVLMSGERSEGQIYPRTYAEALPPGRAKILRRGDRTHLAQFALFPGGGSRAT